MSYTFHTQVSAREYDDFVTSQSTCNVLQSAAWAQVKNSWDSARVCLRDTNGHIVAAALVLQRPLALGFAFWYVPHGPILDYSHTDVLNAFVRELARYARRSRAVSLCIDPPVAVRAGDLQGFFEQPLRPEALHVKNVIEQAGYRHAGFTMGLHETLQPRFIPATLPAPDGNTFQSMPKRTRNFVRAAGRRYVHTKRGSRSDLPQFMDVINQTEESKGIALRSQEYFARLMDIYGEDAVLQLAYVNLDEAIAGYRASITQTESDLADLPDHATNKRQQLEAQIRRERQHLAEVEERRPIDGAEVTLAGCLAVRYGPAWELLYAGTNRHYGTITAQDAVWMDIFTYAFEEEDAAYVSLGGVDGSLRDSLMNFKKRFRPTVYEKVGEFDYSVIPGAAQAFRWYLKRR